MSKLSFDYSRFDRIVDSDDEDSHHPNLDRGLNQRVIRITRDRKEDEIDQEISELKKAGLYDEKAKTKAEKKRPLHMGNMCKVAEERTIITSSDGSKKDRLIRDAEEFVVDDYQSFKEEHLALLEEFTEADWEKSHKMLAEHGGILLDDYAKNYYLLTTLEMEMKGDKEMVQKLGVQGQIVSQIHQIAAPMNRPPRDLVHRFFERFQSSAAHGAFQEGVDHFLEHIRKRAIQKQEEMREAEEAEAAEEAQQGEKVSLVEAMHDMPLEQRLGPGGLDPVEVFDSLPVELQECFKSGDVAMLKNVSQTMDAGQFNHHFQRCVDSGLWTPAPEN